MATGSNQCRTWLCPDGDLPEDPLADDPCLDHRSDRNGTAILCHHRLVEFLGSAMDGGAVCSRSTAATDWHEQEDRRSESGRNHPVRIRRACFRCHVLPPCDFSLDHPPHWPWYCSGSGYSSGTLSFAEKIWKSTSKLTQLAFINQDADEYIVRRLD